MKLRMLTTTAGGAGTTGASFRDSKLSLWLEGLELLPVEREETRNKNNEPGIHPPFITCSLRIHHLLITYSS